MFLSNFTLVRLKVLFTFNLILIWMKKTNPLFICVMIDHLHLPSRPLKAEKTLYDTVRPLSLRQRLEALTVPHSLGNLREKVPSLLWAMKSVPWLVAAPNFW